MKQSITWLTRADPTFDDRKRKFVALSSALWTIIGAVIALQAFSSVNHDADARPLIIGWTLVTALAGIGATVSAVRGMRRLTILFLLLSVLYPTYFAWVLSLIPLALAGYLLYLPRKGRKLTWKAMLLVVIAGLVLTLAIGLARTPNSDLIVVAVRPVPFDLMTHCGIDELRSNGRYFQRVGGILDDGSHNPPSGWGNPIQHGTLTITGDVAVFRDKQGHIETFKVRSGATGFLNICN